MHKGTIYKLLRCLVCLILVCCILINCSPLRAKATMVGGYIAGKTAAGVLGWLFSAAMGAVFVDVTYDTLTSMGNDIHSHVGEYYKDDVETSNTVIGYLDDLSYNFGGSGDGTNNGDDSGNENNPLTHLPTALFVALMDWAKGLINGDSVLVEDVDVSESEPPITSTVYYIRGGANTISATGEFVIGLVEYTNGTNQYRHVYAVSDSKIKAGSRYFTLDSNTGYYYYQFYQTGGYSTVFEESFACDDPYLHVFLGDGASISGLDAMPQLVEYFNGKKDVQVVPDLYVGDIPQKVQDGTFDDDEYQLPYINPAPFFQNQTDVVDALNNVATQLQDQTMTYEQYMEQIQTEGEATDPDPDPDNPEPDSELGQFTLDLKKFFPFCIPFDLYDFLTCLAADPVAPVINWQIPVPGGDAYSLSLDLSPFDSVAQLLRRLELLLFCVGLAIKTRDLIKG